MVERYCCLSPGLQQACRTMFALIPVQETSHSFATKGVLSNHDNFYSLERGSMLNRF